MVAVLDRPTIETVKFSLAQYHKLAALGIFANRRVELLNGEITVMAPMNPPHLWTIRALNELLLTHVPKGWAVLPQCPIQLSQDSEPEPDFAVLKADPPPSTQHTPQGAQVALLIEISDSTLRYDQGIKLALYASASIPEYWVVDLENTVIHQYSDPQPATRTYGSHKTLKPGELITSITVPSVSLAVKDILGV
jgi:Uma2 family endonuclease